jgi:hypothetical protein
MKTFKENFTTYKVFLSVIHVVVKEETFKNVKIAIEAKVDGIFLTSKGHKDKHELIEIAVIIKKRYPQLWVGINFLDVEASDVFNFLNEQKFYPDGVWINNNDIKIESKDKSKKILLKNWYNYKKNGFKGLYFEGVPFKNFQQLGDLSKIVSNKNG